MEQELLARFEDIYDDVVRESKDLIISLRRKTTVYVLIIGCVLILISMLLYFFEKYRAFWKLAVACSVFITMVLFFSVNAIFSNKYKQILIGNILKHYRERAVFNPNGGISRAEYKNADFNETYDSYSSEDKISDTLASGNRFELCEVKTTEEERVRSSYDKKERVEHHIKFSGMFGVVYLEKRIKNEIFINVDSLTQKFNKDRVEVDSAEFENSFDLLSKDRIVALQIFTSDILEKILEYKKIYKKYLFELRIKDNRVYFRLSCGSIFEPPAFGNGLTKEMILKYFRLIYYPIELLEALDDNINRYIALADIPDYEENDPIKNN